MIALIEPLTLGIWWVHVAWISAFIFGGTTRRHNHN